jgi:hypothetical protein
MALAGELWGHRPGAGHVLGEALAQDGEGVVLVDEREWVGVGMQSPVELVRREV